MVIYLSSRPDAGFDCRVDRSFTVEPLITAIVASIVQFFLAWRVYAVSNRRLVIPITILVLSVGQLGWGIASTVMIWILRDFSKFGEFTVSSFLSSHRVAA